MSSGVVAAFAVVGYYTAYILTCLPKFRDTESGISAHEYWTGRLSLNVGKGIPS